MQQPPQQGPPVVVMNPGAPLGPRTTVVTCPMCHNRNFSRVEYASSSKTHIIATILGITTCCCCIPYCIDSCQNADHYCTSCDTYLGTYKT